MNIVGLGSAGCAIAEALSKYPQYNIYKIDAVATSDFDFANAYEDPAGTNFFGIEEKQHPEEYEAEIRGLKTFFQGIDGEVVFILSGGAKIAGASLVILQHLKHCKVTVLYVKPNCDTLEDVKVRMHNVCFGVLQEYARSAVFERLIIVDNNVVESILGEVPIIGYYDKLNELIVWIFHMLNVLKNSKPVMGKINETKVTSRLTSIGTVDFDSGEEKMFFSLDNIREKGYFYLLRKEDLTSSGSLLKKITEQVKSLEEEGARSSYAIYSSEYDQNYVFCMTHTPHIQGGN
mgnify:CR=1 FL=1|tara:strand:- start:1417 stop:2286 length:870 start_codon:yes stop_codon:yes gene_type:complete